MVVEKRRQSEITIKNEVSSKIKGRNLKNSEKTLCYSSIKKQISESIVYFWIQYALVIENTRQTIKNQRILISQKLNNIYWF